MRKRVLFLAGLLIMAVLACAACGGSGGKENNKVAVVIGDEADRGAAEQIKNALGDDVELVTDEEETGAAVEILVGTTNRERSQTLAKGIREKDCWVRFGEDSIVIQGGTQEKLTEAVQWFVENAAPGYEESGVLPSTSDSDYLGYGIYSMQSLTIDGSGIYEYSIVTKDGQETEAALFLQQHIAGMSDYTLPIIAPSALADGQKAIILGSSGARDAADKVGGLDQKEYLAEAEGDSLYLCAWDETKENIVVSMFLGETLGCQFVSDTPSKANMALENYSFKFTTAFDGSDKFRSMTSPVTRLEAINEFNVLQGGCTDGTYAYYILQDQKLASGNCIIVKMDVNTWETLAVSDPLPLDHGNGITYVPSRKQFLVANCDPDPTKVTWVDAETLTVVSQKTLPYSVYALSYNESRNMYAGYGLSKVMMMIDEGLNVTESYNGLASSYTTQGYDVDDDYVYIVSCTSNYIHVCDWEGHWIQTIPIKINTEMENMISFDDLHYTSFLNAGADICMTIFYRIINQ